MRAAVLTLALAGAASCESDRGACGDGGVVCSAADRLVECSKTAKVSYPCKGPRGCTTRDGAADCDVTGNAAGDPCRAADTPRCAGAKLVGCEQGRTTIRSCTGPNGCRPGDPPACDQTIAPDGAPCDDAAAVACRDDSKALLACRVGRFAIEARCEEGCRVASGAPVCSGARLDLDRFFGEELPRAMRAHPKQVRAALRGDRGKEDGADPTTIRLRIDDRQWLVDLGARRVSKPGTKEAHPACTVTASAVALELLLLRPELAVPLFFSGRMEFEGHPRCSVVLPKVLALRAWPAALLPPTESLSDVPLP